MNEKESAEYLEGKIAVLERLCTGLFLVLVKKSLGVMLSIDLLPTIKGIRDEVLVDHPGLFSTPFGRGIDDTLAEMSRKLRSDLFSQ